MAQQSAPFLELRGVSKGFPGVIALEDVDFELRLGEVHALIGENGAGKSTLIKIIAGVYRRDAGSMHIDGKEVDFRDPSEAIAQRIKVVYQELELIPNLSIAENVFLGEYPKTAFGSVDWHTLHEQTATLLADLGLEIDPGTLIKELRVPEQQLVEIARTLSRQAKIIIMDEPTSALSAGEIEKLFTVIRKLRQRGVGIIYVSHKLEEIYQIADRVTVFRDGQRIVTKPVAETTTHDLVTWMVGREIQDLFPKTISKKGKPLLEARNINSQQLHDFDLTVHAGEVVAVFGLMGGGVHTIGRVLIGAEKRSGTLTLDGEPIQPGAPTHAISKGMGLLTENRKEDGLVLPLSVKANITVTALRKFVKFSWINSSAEVKAASDYVQKLDIKTPSLNQKIQFLSGGNQQKALIGRWLLENLKMLILSEPTRGIDVGSKAEIYRLIDDMAHQGMGILVLSTELPEVLGIADRIIVVREGRIVREFTRDEATQENLMAAAAVAHQAQD
jgi:ribose transport system ATP-binding protein